MFQDFLQQQIALYRLNCAIRVGEREISYGQLETQSAIITGWIRSRQIEKGTIIALLFDERDAYISAIIGVLNAGCCFMPIDATATPGRVATMLGAVNCAWMLCDENTLASMNGRLAVDTVRMFNIKEVLHSTFIDKAVFPEITFNGEDRIYIYFTSGSSGKPKAIVGKNKSLQHFIQWEITHFKLQAGWQYSQFTNVGFDAFLRDIFTPLCSGGTINILAAGILQHPEKLRQWIDDHSLNVIHCVPSLFKVFSQPDAGKRGLESVEYIFLSGEAIAPSMLKKWFAVHGISTQLVNLYGPTETTMIKTFYLIGPADTDLKRIPVGKPMTGCRILILDSNLCLCDVLVEGEIYIRTPYRTHGYYEEELNKDKFIMNPLSGDPKDLLYRTGDIGRYLPDGNIDLHGRIDRQIKIRGVRIEPGEIEDLLRRHPSISDAIVIMESVKNGEGDILVCFLACCDTFETPAETSRLREEISAFLAKDLPDNMIPVEYIQVPAVKRLPNGKVDYEYLRVVYKERHREVKQPESKLHQELMDLWMEVFNTPVPGITNTFFEIGGHSLNIHQLINSIEKRFNIRLTIQDIYKNATIEKQAAIIEKSIHPVSAGIKEREKQEYYELSSAQKRVYFLNALNKDSLSYNITPVFEIEGALNPALTAAVFEQLAARHESLRTSFDFINDTPKQKIHETVVVKVEYFKEVDAEACMHAFVRPFELNRPPLFRLGIIEVERGKYLFMVDVHHIIADGISLGILAKEFLLLYNGHTLPALKITYKDYVLWEQQKTARAVLQRAFWLKDFSAGIPLTDLPADYRRPVVRSHDADMIACILTEEETRKIRALAVSRETSLFTYLFAAFNILLSKLTGRNEIVVGMPASGRTNVLLEDLVGMFVNTLPIRSYLDSEWSFTTFLPTVAEHLVRAFDNQDYPYEQLVEDLRLKRDAGRNALFEVMFAMQYADGDKSSLAGMNIRNYEGKSYKAKFDLTVTLVEAQDLLAIRFLYNTRLFDKRTIERYISIFRNILDQLVADPAVRICDIRIVSANERERLLYSLNNTDCPYPEEKTVIHLFKEQANREPDRIALIWNDQYISYAALDSRSEQLAACLAGKGIQPGKTVAVIADRSIALVTAILAVLKTGAAYIPVDPGYPVDRIEYLLQDSQAALLLTEKKNSTTFSWSGRQYYLDDETLYQGTAGARPAGPSSGDTAYLIYTSGTTGYPKGVIIKHKSLTNYIVWAGKQYIRKDKANFALCTSISFDLTVTSIFTPLITGNAIVIFSDTTQNLIEKVVLDKRVDIVKLTPSHLKILNDEGLRLKEHSIVNTFIIGGEELSNELANSIYDQYRGKAGIFNEYGPTEATVGCMVHKFIPGNFDKRGVPVGHPIDNMKIYILDEWKNPVPAGVQGELYISGDGVAEGYLNKTAFTDKHFLPDPFQKGLRMYRTGDLAKRNADDTIEFIGRTDDQVKVRGYRIELGEITSRLDKHPEIVTSTIRVVQEGQENVRLYAYYVARKNADIASLEDYLLKALPGYMIPAGFIRLPEMPLTVNGKINQQLLPDPVYSLEDRNELLLPENETEQQLLAVWQDVLQEQQISVHRNFFDIGGNSIKMIIILRRLSRLFGQEIPLVLFFTYPTIRSLSNFLKKQEEQCIISEESPEDTFDLLQTTSLNLIAES